MLPLQDLVVLDLTIARAGPTAVRLLADWGANVVRIEPVSSNSGSLTGRRDGSDEQNLHRNKRSVCIDLKSKQGQETFAELVRRADVVVENFRAPVKHRLGVDYRSLRALNERVILASISGFGQTGPYSDRGGVDQIVQGTSGLMSITGHKDQGPTRVGIAISDTTAGMFLGQGILLALIQREKTGRGDWVHTSLLEGMLCKLDFQGARYTMLGEVPEQQGNDHPTAFPMGTFRCKTGWVNIAAMSDKMWNALLDVLNAANLKEVEDYSSVAGRIRNKEALRNDLEQVLANFSVEDLVEPVNAAGVPCGPINSVADAYEDPQAKHLKVTKTAPHKRLGDIGLLRSPIQMENAPQSETFDRSAPDPGEHSREILLEFGFSDHQVDELVACGAVGEY